MITALELRTGGTAAPALPPLRPSSPHSRHPPNQSPSSPGPMVAPTPRDTEDTRGRREPHIPAHTHPPPISTPRRSPCRAGAAPLLPPGSRGARPEGGGGREAVPGLPRWSGPGTGSAGDAEVRAGTARSSGLQLFSSVPVGNAARVAAPPGAPGAGRALRG